MLTIFQHNFNFNLICELKEFQFSSSTAALVKLSNVSLAATENDNRCARTVIDK